MWKLEKSITTLELCAHNQIGDALLKYKGWKSLK